PQSLAKCTGFDYNRNNLKVKEKQSRFANLHRERWKLRAAPRRQNPKNMFHNLLRDKAQTLLTLRA
ncbi:hypothetical protein PZH44_13360, partial [Alistipes putredinis]|nr:hypothetical protein [Alistipes putredinis]